MAPKQVRSLIEWLGMAFFTVGSAGAIGSSEWADKTSQAAYWPGYAVNLPIFFAGAALLLWSSRRSAEKTSVPQE
jgi:hypothetical protein